MPLGERCINAGEYADDAIVHCVSERQACAVLAAIESRMGEVGFRLHPGKTRIVYYKHSERRGLSENPSCSWATRSALAPLARTL